MSCIYYQSLTPQLLKTLRQMPERYQCVPYEGQETFDDEAVLFITGDNRPYLIPVIQEVSRKDADIGIIVIASDPLSPHQLKVAIQFAPFINKHVQVVDALDMPKLRDLIRKEATLTSTRKEYRKTRKVFAQTPLVLNHQIKSTFFDQFLYQAPVGVVLLNQNQLILDANDYVEKLLDAGQLDNARYFPEIFGEEKSKVEKLLNVQSAQTKVTTTLKVRSKGSQPKYVELHISEVVVSSSSFKMVILVDVTGEVLAEKKVQNYLARLENHNRELEQFARVISHDLKSPLSTIQVSGEMAARVPAEKKDHLINVIYRSANNLRQMIEGLEEILDVRKSGPARPVPVAFQQVLDNVLSTYQLRLEHEDVSLNADFKDAPSIIYVESYLTSIFHNMISNALKYRKAEEPLRVKIRTEKKDGFTLLAFSDNGIGIDLDKHKQNLFQPFRRFTAQANGRGIGLSMIKSMIEKNNGKIEVRSTPGAGSTFYCYLCPYE